MTPDSEREQLAQPYRQLFDALVAGAGDAVATAAAGEDASRRETIERLLQARETRWASYNSFQAADLAQARERRFAHARPRLHRLSTTDFERLVEALEALERREAELDAMRRMRKEQEDRQRAARTAQRQEQGAAAERQFLRAEADFEAWARKPSWSFDESLALLLGRDPLQVSGGQVKEWKGVSAFADQFARLRHAAAMSEEMVSSPRLEPSAVIRWAERAAVVQVPARLRELLSGDG